MSDLSAVRLFIATPAYGGAVTVAYLHSVMAACRRLAAFGATVAVDTVTNESLITRARNGCVARFLAARTGGQPFTHLLFVDADIGFPAPAIERLLTFGEPFVAGVYPLKHVRYDALWERMREAAPAPASAQALEAESLHYAHRVELPAVVRHDFVRVLSVGCGFMLLRREVIERLVARHGAATRYANDIAGYETPTADFTLEPMTFHALFETAIDPATGCYESEDYAFCRRWRALGGEIWADLRLDLDHVGAHRYAGSFARYLAHAGVLVGGASSSVDRPPRR